MSMHTEYYMEGLEVLETVLAVLFSSVPSSVLGIAGYVLTSLALYTLATRRGIQKAWLSWVPVLNVWIIGSLSDQYRYVVHGEYKSKRKSLLVLNLLMILITAVMAVVAVCMVVELFTSSVYGAFTEEIVMGPIIAIVLLALPLAGLGIAAMVVRFMALYDVYKSMDPDNCVLFLVLSILAGVTEPFFLFFNRNKDGGMPPRRSEPQWEPQNPVYTQPREESWQEPENSEYL